MQKKEKNGAVATNRKASHNYFLSDEIETGIVLEGSEVKSIRQGHISITESFVQIKNDEMYLKNAYIKNYENAGAYIPDERRNRKLLLHKNQIAKYKKKVETEGLTIVPLKVYINNDGKVKVLIAVGKGKKLYDKRESLKQKQIDRTLSRLKKY